MNKVYVTTMYRWGSSENHSYIVYAGDNLACAIQQGVYAFEYRGCGKYIPEVVCFEDGTARETILLADRKIWQRLLNQNNS